MKNVWRHFQFSPSSIYLFWELVWIILRTHLFFTLTPTPPPPTPTPTPTPPTPTPTHTLHSDTTPLISMPFCSECGASHIENVTFCQNCGIKIPNVATSGVLQKADLVFAETDVTVNTASVSATAVQPVTQKMEDRESLYDTSKHDNGGPRPDQNTCCAAYFCLANMIMCPLHCCAMCGWNETVETATSIPVFNKIPCSPCNPNAKMPLWFGSEPIGWAASFGQLHSVMVLTKAGGNPLRQNLAGQTAYSDAKRERHQHVVNWIEEWRRVEGK